MNIFRSYALFGQDSINFVDHISVSAKITKRILIDRVFLQIMGSPSMKISFRIESCTKNITVARIMLMFTGILCITDTMKDQVLWGNTSRVFETLEVFFCKLRILLNISDVKLFINRVFRNPGGLLNLGGVFPASPS